MRGLPPGFGGTTGGFGGTTVGFGGTTGGFGGTTVGFELNGLGLSTRLSDFKAPLPRPPLVAAFDCDAVCGDQECPDRYGSDDDTHVAFPLRSCEVRSTRRG